MTDSERPQRRPPWWPEAEPWPPQGRMRWRHGRPPPFVRRLFILIPLAVVTLFVLVVGGATVLFWLVATRIGGGQFHAGRQPFTPIGAFGALVIVSLLLVVPARA